MEEIYRYFTQATGVCFDTRKIKAGEMFFALKTETNDGKKYIPQAIEKGASCIIYDGEVDFEITIPSFQVEDTLRALQDLAHYHRMKFNIPVIAITGSNGKTTTKELVREVLSQKYKVQATIGNFNNHIGVPVTLLGITSNHDVAIIEMGANHVGEINMLCNIAAPDYGLITSIGKAHLEGFGGIEGVIQGKTELYRYLDENGGTAFVNQRSSVLMNNLPQDLKRRLYTWVDILLSTDNTIEVKIDDYNYETQLVGRYNADNVACAVAVGKHFNVEANSISTAIANYVPEMNRSQYVEMKNVKIILDAYNANPVSMKSAIENFAEFDDEKKILIIGDMLELGKYSFEEHKNIIELVDKYRWQKVITVGKEFSEHDRFINYASVAELKKDYSLDQFRGSYLLLKGSRGIGLERFLN